METSFNNTNVELLFEKQKKAMDEELWTLPDMIKTFCAEHSGGQQTWSYCGDI